MKLNNFFPGFPVVRIEWNAIDRADFHALGRFVVTNTLGTQIRIDDIDLFALGNRTVRALRLTYITVDALVGDHQRHGNFHQKIRVI